MDPDSTSPSSTNLLLAARPRVQLATKNFHPTGRAVIVTYDTRLSGADCRLVWGFFTVPACVRRRSYNAPCWAVGIRAGQAASPDVDAWVHVLVW